MKINLPSNVRAILYAIIAVSSPVVAYLGTQGKLSDFAVGLFSVVVTAISALAFSNVN
jgi:uncharacterized membrane protein YjdF